MSYSENEFLASDGIMGFVVVELEMDAKVGSRGILINAMLRYAMLRYAMPML